MWCSASHSKFYLVLCFFFFLLFSDLLLCVVTNVVHRWSHTKFPTRWNMMLHSVRARITRLITHQNFPSATFPCLIDLCFSILLPLIFVQMSPSCSISAEKAPRVGLRSIDWQQKVDWGETVSLFFVAKVSLVVKRNSDFYFSFHYSHKGTFVFSSYAKLHYLYQGRCHINRLFF